MMIDSIQSIKAPSVQKYFSVNALDDSFFILDSKSKDSGEANHTIIATNFPIKLDVGIAILCKSGFLSINIGYSNYTVSANDFINILANRVFQVMEVSDDFEAKILCLKPDYIEVDNNQYSFNIRNLLYEFPHHTLPGSKLELFLSLFDYCQSVVLDRESIFRKQLIKSVLNTMFLELCNILVVKDQTKTKDTPNDMFVKFMKNVEMNFKKERNIKFYAEKANLTPKYFSSVIYRLTGRLAKVWIDEYAVLEIKALLKSTNLTIQQISYDLNFATPSHFSAYFKHHTKLSPGQYRKG